MTHSSHGYRHHADSTTERPDGKIEVTFQSKQTGQWGRIVVPTEAVQWSDSHPTSMVGDSVPDPLRELAEWLVSREEVWLDPNRTVERQTVTLQQIIDRARKALGRQED